MGWCRASLPSIQPVDSLSFMGKGRHRIIQNEETLETEHDPYSDTALLILNAAEKSVGHMKNGETSKSLGCFKAYHSESYHDFIARQGAYVLHISYK
ncbi:hypothetical protein SAMN03084138_00878 [Enterovibrio norvegicus DSM 15893]|uniref:Uncharacterized protein n=1 Tax=Enterovibrio norvegicus DSM 15893 TaxID=1121869 RepID=A0A1I5L9F7_9GAMM|nr:hypothetical protein SAMN03084138_00878 [Enterovibrio norvegicus DSM 15893]